jgi:hypothetical protein
LGALHNRKMANMEKVDSPVFGTLRQRVGSKDAWMGSIRLDEFQNFGAISVDRSTWDDSYTRSEELASDLPWNVARGSSALWVYTKPGVAPGQKQQSAFAHFRTSPASAAIQAEVFNHYLQTFSARREGFLMRGDSSAEQTAASSKKRENLSGPARLIGAMFERLLDTAPAHKLGPRERRSMLEKNNPAIKNASELRTITELSAINLFPEQGGDAGAIGFLFSGAWIGDAGLGVRWRDGKIEGIGTKEIATPVEP